MLEVSANVPAPSKNFPFLAKQTAPISSWMLPPGKFVVTPSKVSE